MPKTESAKSSFPFLPKFSSQCSCPEQLPGIEAHWHATAHVHTVGLQSGVAVSTMEVDPKPSPTPEQSAFASQGLTI